MFAPSGKYEACGLFNTTHFIALAVCLILVIVAVYFSRNISEKKFNTITRISAIGITILEIVKIIYNLYYDFNAPINNWLPLHFCSLFIYSLWLSGYFSGHIKKIGESFLIGGGIIAGLTFLIVPSTSLRLFPIFHFQCLYSLLFHALFLYFGLVILIRNFFTLNLKSYLYYVIFTSFFCIIAYILNTTTEANFMFLENPWSIPLPFLATIRNSNHYLYSLIIYLAYVVGTYFPIMFIQKLINHFRKGESNA